MNLEDNLQTLLDKNKKLKKSIKFFQKPEEDVEPKDFREDLHIQIQELKELYSQLENDIMHPQEEETAAEEKESSEKRLGHLMLESFTVEEARISGENHQPAFSSKKDLSVQEQEMIYDLKVKQMKNLEVQNANLCHELGLHRKKNQNKQDRPQYGSHLSQSNQLKLIKVLEKKGKEAERKLNEMQHELNKLQSSVKKYQQLYEAEKLKNSSQSAPTTQSSQASEPSTPGRLSREQNSRAPAPSSARPYDVIRKNELLMEENEVLKAEIKKLNRENTDYLKRAKNSDAERDCVLNRLETSEMARKDLLKRLQKEKNKHQQLTRSLTLQANDWVQMKKQLHRLDEDVRWSQVGSAGSSRHTPKSRPLPKSIYKPQKTQSAEQCAQ